MGQPLTIHNQTPDEIFVEWKTSPGGVFQVAAYHISPWANRAHTAEAVWYDIYIVHKGKRFTANFYGGGTASWTFNGTNIINNIGNINRSESLSPAENGVVAVPLNHPVVKSIVSYFQSLEVSPQQ